MLTVADSAVFAGRVRCIGVQRWRFRGYGECWIV
jgi:hypothetical protein